MSHNLAAQASRFAAMPSMSNWANRTLFVADNLRIMRGMNSGSVDLIATDPPFNTKRQFNAPLGSRAAKARFDDRWTWDEVAGEWSDLLGSETPAIRELIEAVAVIEGGSVDRRTGRIDTGRVKNSMAAFLCWMAPRLIEMKRVLKPTGSIYLHCDDSANSYLRLLMDAVFGRKAFRNEIVWCYTGPGNVKRHFKRKHDTILFYAMPEAGFDVDAVRVPHARKKPSGGLSSLAAAGRSKAEIHKREAELIAKGKIPEDWWADIGAGSHMPKSERTGWPTQKPLALYERIIKASSSEGDLVLDPFCGCATTCVAAERLGRHWVGIEIDPVAETVTKARLQDETGLFGEGDASPVTVRKSITRTDVPELDAGAGREARPAPAAAGSRIRQNPGSPCSTTVYGDTAQLAGARGVAR